METPSLERMHLPNSVILILSNSQKPGVLLGTWNLVNESKGAMGNMSMDDMNNMTATSEKK